ncbi:MAG: hypothetical protein OSA23_12920, partial [Rhodospirillales bacterium]|nr:hypothetical protein [Rhodospirillales bacterium]
AGAISGLQSQDLSQSNAQTTYSDKASFSCSVLHPSSDPAATIDAPDMRTAYSTGWPKLTVVPV